MWLISGDTKDTVILLHNSYCRTDLKLYNLVENSLSMTMIEILVGNYFVCVVVNLILFV